MEKSCHLSTKLNLAFRLLCEKSGRSDSHRNPSNLYDKNELDIFIFLGKIDYFQSSCFSKLIMKRHWRILSDFNRYNSGEGFQGTMNRTCWGTIVITSKIRGFKWERNDPKDPKVSVQLPPYIKKLYLCSELE